METGEAFWKETGGQPVLERVSIALISHKYKKSITDVLKK
jgi:hypothetical protein